MPHQRTLSGLAVHVLHIQQLHAKCLFAQKHIGTHMYTHMYTLIHTHSSNPPVSRRWSLSWLFACWKIEVRLSKLICGQWNAICVKLSCQDCRIRTAAPASPSPNPLLSFQSVFSLNLLFLYLSLLFVSILHGPKSTLLCLASLIFLSTLLSSLFSSSLLFLGLMGEGVWGYERVWWERRGVWRLRAAVIEGKRGRGRVCGRG